jgi:hypothetical protein
MHKRKPLQIESIMIIISNFNYIQMKTTKLFLFFISLLCTSINLNSQTSAVLKGNKVSVHTIDGVHGDLKGINGYSYSNMGGYNIELLPGNHTIEFAPHFGDKSEYELIFIAEAGKTYTIKNGDKDIPVLFDAKNIVSDARITKVNYVPVDINDPVIHLYSDKIENKNLSILSVNPEKNDIVTVVYKIDDIWGPVLEPMSVTRRYNNYKKGNSFQGAVKVMTLTVELLPGEHTIAYSSLSNKGMMLIFPGNSYIVNKLKFNFEAGKSYTFKYLDEKDPTSLIIIEKIE